VTGPVDYGRATRLMRSSCTRSWPEGPRKKTRRRCGWEGLFSSMKLAKGTDIGYRLSKCSRAF